MKYVWFVAAIVSVRFLVTGIGFPPGDGDLAWQRWLGATILATHHIPRALGEEVLTAPGAPWTPQEWFFSLCLAWAGEKGWPFFAGAVSLCPVAALLLTAYRAVRRGASPLDTAFVSTAMGTALFDSFGVRVQVTAWPMLALFLLALDEEGAWLWATVPIAAVWSNLHASAMLAPVLAATVAVGRLWEDRAWTPRVARIAAVAGAVGAAICCNPFGVGLPLYAVSLFGSPIKHYISEWKPTDVGDYSFSAGSLPLLLCAVAVGIVVRGRKGSAADALVFASFSFLLFFAARNIAVFAIVVAPMVARGLTDALGRMYRNVDTTRLDRIAKVVLPIFVAFLLLLVGYHLLHSPERSELTMPFKEINAIARMPGERRVMCADFAWCSYLIGVPGKKLFLDGRADPYPPAVWEDFADVAYLRPRWRQALKKYGVDTIIVRRGTSVDQALALTKQWREVTHDEKFRLWVFRPAGLTASPPKVLITI